PGFCRFDLDARASSVLGSPRAAGGGETALSPEPRHGSVTRVLTREEASASDRLYLLPFDASRKTANSCRRLSPSEANFGIGEPGFTQDGHFRWRTLKSTPRLRVPIAVRSGAPRLDEPVPR